MGKPQYPTKEEIDSLRRQSILTEPEFEDLINDSLTLQLPVNRPGGAANQVELPVPIVSHQTKITGR